MFQNLTERLSSTFDKLRKRGVLTEEHVNEAMREVRIALLEADVALPVVKDFIAKAKEKAIGTAVINSISPAQMVVKIVQDCLAEMLGSEGQDLNLNARAPVVILMAGLQGSGKTTTTGKLALRLKDKQHKKVLMASLDVYRPAAQEQLATLGKQTGVDTLPIIAGQQPEDIARRALKEAELGAYDVLFLDTAGRLHIDDALMQELQSVKQIAKPTEILLVADSLTGQDAVNVGKTFHESVGITGIILTRVDGDARGGAALSMRAVTGCPIKFLGMGEKLTEIEPFHPDRIAARILDMGDIVSLVEQAAAQVDTEEAKKLAAKVQKGHFDMNDLASQLKQMRSMGGIMGIAKFLPGVGKIKDQLDKANVDDKMILRQEAIISSMTKKERRNPDILNASRRIRIAEGSGTSVQDVNRLLKQFKQMQGMMKKLRTMDKKSLMRSGLGGMFQ